MAGSSNTLQANSESKVVVRYSSQSLDRNFLAWHLRDKRLTRSTCMQWKAVYRLAFSLAAAMATLVSW